MESLRFIKRHLVSIIFACITIYIMIMIFSFSAQTGEISAGVSKGVSRTIAKMLVEGFSSLSEADKQIKIEALVPFVRKTAHFLVYCALGFFSYLTAASFLMENKKDITLKKNFLKVSLFCLFYAASDEIHQLFVIERSGSPLDVLLDFCGAVVGILFSALVFYIFCKLKDKSTSKQQKYQK